VRTAPICALLLVLLLPAGEAAAQRLRAPFRSRDVSQPVTFSNAIVRIFQEHCQVCHRPGDVGPFSLLSYSTARLYAQRIKNETETRRMPPWKPVPGYGEFQDERRLTDQQIRLIARWVEAGAPEGDAAELPPPRYFPEGWALGSPDLVLEPPSAYTIPAEGSDIYRCFSLPVGLLQDRYVTGVEVLPGNRAVVHHMILFADPLGLSTRLDEQDPGPGYECFGGPGFFQTGVLGAWAPGNQPQRFPEGVGLRLPATGRVVMQLHYHPNGLPQSDRTRVGLHLNSGPVIKELQLLVALNFNFVIPAGASRHVVTAAATVPPGVTARAIAVIPHMHLLGREIRLEAVFPEGARRPLIYIDDWDFEWQATYYYKEPVRLPGGTRLELTAVYDNSAGNPKNPNRPPQDVRFGERTTDEMCLAGIWYVEDTSIR
jgi:mono/diheme cytochrome c family protein